MIKHEYIYLSCTLTLLPCILKSHTCIFKILSLCLPCPYFSGIYPDRSWVFLWQSQTGSMGRHSVPLLSALSPSQSLWWSPLSPVKALPCVQLHLWCACHQVFPHSYTYSIVEFLVTESLSFYLLFQIGTASWTRLHSQTTVWLCCLWHCRCVAVLHSSDQGFDISFADRGIVSSYNEQYVMFHYCRLQLLSQSLHLNLSCYVRCKGQHLKFGAVIAWFYIIYVN